MPKLKDRTDDRYGRLLVLSYVGKDHRNKHLWLCKCDCGNEKVVVSDNLSSGKSKSCGCLKTEWLRNSGNQYSLYGDREKAILKVQYSHLKRRSSKKSKDAIVLTFDDFFNLSKQPCFYCGLEYSREIKDRHSESQSRKLLSNTVVKCNGIDRVDSSVAYTKENCVPCCKFCNTAKNTLTKDEFFNLVKRIAEHNNLW